VPGGEEAGYAHSHRIQPGRYGRAILFIDDDAFPPCGDVPIFGLPCLPDPGFPFF